MTMNQLVATDDVNHGSAFYLLTGTADFGYFLDSLIEDDFISEDDRRTILNSKDGYRIKLAMVGQKKPLDAAGDVEAICLFSDQAGGAICGGISYNGSSVVSWGKWIPQGFFVVARDSSEQFTDPVDQATEWYKFGIDGNDNVGYDGTDDVFWSVFKFQPLESQSGYEDDYRFNPDLTDVIPYVYQVQDDVASFYAGSTILLEGALGGLSVATLATLGALTASFMTF